MAQKLQSRIDSRIPHLLLSVSFQILASQLYNSNCDQSTCYGYVVAYTVSHICSLGEITPP